MIDKFTDKLVDKASDLSPHPNGDKCEACGTETIDHCPFCGAPQCCPKCCAEAGAGRELNRNTPTMNHIFDKVGADILAKPAGRSQKANREYRRRLIAANPSLTISQIAEKYDEPYHSLKYVRQRMVHGYADRGNKILDDIRKEMPALLKEGFVAKRWACSHGYDVQAVRRYLQLSGIRLLSPNKLNPNRITPVHKARVELVKAHPQLSFIALGKKFGISYEALRQACLKAGYQRLVREPEVPEYKRRIKTQLQTEMEKLQKEGVILRQWAETHGVQPWAVSECLRKLNIRLPSPLQARLNSGHALCSRCRQLLPLERFYTKANGRPSSFCKACVRQVGKLSYRRMRLRNPERHRQYVRRYRQKNRRAINQGHRRYYQKNREKILAYQKHRKQIKKISEMAKVMKQGMISNIQPVAAPPKVGLWNKISGIFK